MFKRSQLVAVWMLCMQNFARISGKEVTACYSEQVTLKCPKEGDVIVVTDAVYGRTNSETCDRMNKSPDGPPFCWSHGTEGLLNRKCFGKQQCHVTVNEEMFGDSCEGKTMYLDAHYDCIPESSITPACHESRPILKLGSPTTGYITSPDYPSPYSAQKDCTVILHAREGHKYDVSILDLDMAILDERGCHDWLFIRDGAEERRRMRYCGTLAAVQTGEPTFLPQLKNATVVFKSYDIDAQERVHSGFLLKYQEVEEVRYVHEEL